MPFPDSRRVLFHQNPLVEVICQLRFPPILQIAAETPADFQNRIRHLYPLYEKEDQLPIPKELAGLLAQFAVQSPPETIVHKFQTDDSKELISLSQNFVSVATRKYERWELFREAIGLAERAVTEVYSPAFYSRIGLRYRNVIDRERLEVQGRSWRELIKPPFLGFLATDEVRDEVENVASQAVLRISAVTNGLVQIRYGFTRAKPEDPPAFLIDADFYTEERHTHDNLFGTLQAFNRFSGALFRWAITPELVRVLDPEPLV